MTVAVNPALGLNAATGKPADFDRFTALRFPLILLVIMNHASGTFMSRLHDSPVLYAGLEWIGSGLSLFRMPTLMLIAGVVFFIGCNGSNQWFATKIKSRFASLMVPMLLVNTLWLIVFAIGQSIPFSAVELGKMRPQVLAFNTQELIEAYLGTEWPFVGTLWFLRDLFLMVVLSPIVWWCCRVMGRSALPIVLLCYVAGVDPLIVKPEAFYFFSIGACLAVSRLSVFKLDHAGPGLLLCWLIVELAWIEGRQFQALETQARCLLGIAAILFVSDFVARSRALPALRSLARYSFFLFIGHEPLLTLVVKAHLKYLPPQTQTEVIAAYLLDVAAVVLLLITCFKVGERYAPRALNVVTGGRG